MIRLIPSSDSTFCIAQVSKNSVMTIYVPSMKNKYNSLTAGKTRGQRQYIMLRATTFNRNFGISVPNCKASLPTTG